MEFSQLMQHFAANAPRFAARLAQSGLSADDLRAPADLNRLPIMRKDDLIELQAAEPPFGGLLACDPSELAYLFQSPGPIYEPGPKRADAWRWAEALTAAGFSAGDRVINAFGYHLTPAGIMFDHGLRAIGCAVIPGGVGNQEQQIDVMHALAVSGYIGLPSYLKALLEKAAERGIELALERAFVAAEPLPPSLRDFIESRGIEVRQGYGTAECGNLGYECACKNGWLVPDGVILDICDLTTGQPVPHGETGEVVVTVLKPEYALVRFGVGDLSSLEVASCPCGIASPRLQGWQGRAGDAVKVRGMFLHPRQLAGLLALFPEIARGQAEITRSDHKDALALRVVAQPDGDIATLPERLAAAARERIKLRAEVEIVSAEALPEGEPLIVDQREWK